MNIFIFSLIFICTNCQSVGIEGKNPHPDIKYREPCDYYTDCYNCTIARCRWDISDNPDGKCLGYPEYNNINIESLQIKDFFEYAGACKDYLNLCEKEQSTTNQNIKLSFHNNWKYLPPNYFCVFEM